MLWPFFADRSLTPDRVKPADVLAWVHGIGRSGPTPSSTTVGARIARQPVPTDLNVPLVLLCELVGQAVGWPLLANQRRVST
jgi:hypothetical protein